MEKEKETTAVIVAGQLLLPRQYPQRLKEVEDSR